MTPHGTAFDGHRTIMYSPYAHNVCDPTTFTVDLFDNIWYLFSVEHLEAILHISNTKFENWRFRQRSVINIYSGEVYLENVDFENTESSYNSMPYF